jgi:hypothetical protein
MMMMPQLSIWKQREQAFLLRLLVMQARLLWLGRCVSFVDPEDGERYVGVVSSVSDEGITTVEYQLVPGADEALSSIWFSTGSESRLLTLVSEVLHVTKQETNDCTTIITNYS